MGSLASSIQNTCCCSFKSSQQQYYEINQLQLPQQDDDYFYNQDWYGANEYLSPEKFIFSYQNYRQDQERILIYWKKVDLQGIRHGITKRSKGEVLSVKWKYLIRKGTPCSLMKTIILDLFKLTYVNCDIQYDAALQALFKNRAIQTSFRNVPLFGVFEEDFEFENVKVTEQKLEIYLKTHILNDKGLQSLVKLLWAINQYIIHFKKIQDWYDTYFFKNKKHFQVEFNPMLIQIASLLLIFLDPSQAFATLEFMIEDSLKIHEDIHESMQLRWHIILNQNQFSQFGESFYETVKDKSQSFRHIYKHFKKIKVNFIELFNDLITSLLFTYIPFNLALKIFIIYLNEGVKIYYRFAYAIVRFLLTDILNLRYPEGIRPLIRQKMLHLSLQEQDQLIKKAFSLRLNTQKQNTNTQSQIQLIKQKNKKCYLPVPSSHSDLISVEDFETIWDWLPSSYKLCDPNLIYSTERDGSSMKQMLRLCSQNKQNAMLMVFLSDKKIVFGFFCDQMLHMTSHLSVKFIGTNDTFVFSIKPELKRFAATQKNMDHLYCCEKYISIGNGGEGPAILIHENLTQGYTNRCDTYDNERFTLDFKSKGNNTFKCLKIEIYVIM